MLTALRARRPAGDEGTTLAELVTCMAITTVVGAMALSFFVWTGRASSATTQNSFANQNARAALTTAAGLLRLTVPGSVSPGATSVTFSASDNAVTNCARRPAATVTIGVVSGNLQLTRTGPVSAATQSQPCAFTSNVASSKVLAVGVQSGTGFSYGYRKVNGTVSTNAADIGEITLTLVVQISAGRKQTYTATAAVSGGMT